MMGNKGKTSWGMIALVLIVAAIGYGFYSGMIKLPVTQVTQVTTTGGTGATGCAVNPSLVFTAVDALNPGTAVAIAGGLYKINGGLTATSPTVTGSLTAVLNAAGYINGTVTNYQVGCGSNSLSPQMYAWAAPTESIYATDGVTKIGNSATGASVNNETAAAAGGSYNWRLHLVGTDKKSTGQMIIVIDFTNTSASFASVSMSGGAVPVAIPKGYASQTSGGAQYAFLIPAVVGNSIVDYNIQAVATSSHTIISSVYTTTYSLSPFFDTDGSLQTNLAFNSVGTATYAGTPTTYNFLIK